jgi:hypothetical protein
MRSLGPARTGRLQWLRLRLKAELAWAAGVGLDFRHG